ncbi:hypothetical protein LTR37_021470 [Vermiconidia calcicola]|uniref:Uncharacterized protein n=1 Tax=Vermiconidia calcicola TaxID=1690605 RepID=A0ACC3MA80_9PEZI|nr:hypothetical protein LTR37_021470 [Vermiconidia calcicola]
MDNAMIAFDKYPRMMLLHLVRNYPEYGFEKVRMESDKDKIEFQRRLQRELKLRCLLMASWHTAAPAIEQELIGTQEITARKEAQLISQLSGEI